MKKLIAVAALAAAAFAAPALPVQAASDVPSHCLVLPLLKADCRAAISDAVESGTVTVASATVVTVEEAASTDWPVPVWWKHCAKAPAGSGHLYDCD
jgi:hypothetical protein